MKFRWSRTNIAIAAGGAAAVAGTALAVAWPRKRALAEPVHLPAQSVWSLSPRTQAANAMLPSIPYDGGGPWDPARCAPGLLPHTARLKAMLRETFPWIRTVYGIDCRALRTQRHGEGGTFSSTPIETSHDVSVYGRDARGNPLDASGNILEMSIHSVGRALDVMVPTPSGWEGEELANWLVELASTLGIQLVIWNHSVWQGSSSPTRRFTAYTGDHPHADHVHVEVTLEPGPSLSA